VERRPRRYVTLEGYAVEGGFDGPYQPSTCFQPTFSLGRHVNPGADDVWHDYERVLDLVPSLGFDGVRLSVEWARIEPRRGQLDEAALARYADVARHAASLGLGVTVAIVDWAWPAWLGLEAWLLPWVVPVAVEHATRVVGALEAASGVVVFADPQRLVDGYLRSQSPPWRKGARVDAEFARTQIESISATLLADPVVGPKIVTSTSEVSAGADLQEIRSAFQRDCDELYVRSLVRTNGPMRITGLLSKRDGEWTLPDGDLLELLR
jgi:hypothetical protein